MRGVEASTIEASGASGGVAVRHATLALASGAIDAALILGIEKVTDKASSENPGRARHRNRFRV